MEKELPVYESLLQQSNEINNRMVLRKDQIDQLMQAQARDAQLLGQVREEIRANQRFTQPRQTRRIKYPSIK